MDRDNFRLLLVVMAFLTLLTILTILVLDSSRSNAPGRFGDLFPEPVPGER